MTLHDGCILKMPIRKGPRSEVYSLVRQGLNASNIDADSYHVEQGKKVSGSYIFKPFDTSVEEGL